MKKLTVSLAILVLLGGSGIARAAPIYVYDGGLGTWSDVNKTSVVGSPDSLLCWAAAASNALSWTGWYGLDSTGTVLLDTAAEIYGAFDAGWTNRTGAATYAYEWWMTDRTQSIIPGGQVFDSAGQNFYPTVPVLEGASVTAFWDVSASGFLDALNLYVPADRGIVMTIDVPSGPGTVGPYSHAVTVWGYDPTLSEIYITDSDDGMMALRTYTYSSTGDSFYLNGYSNLYTASTSAHVTEFTRLNRNDTGLGPTGGTVSGVPEPSTLLLLGAGLCGLAFSRKKVLR